MKNLIILILGILIGILIPVLLVKKSSTSNEIISKDIKDILKTNEAKLLLTSKEFVNLLNTPEFKKFSKDFGMQELKNLLYGN